MLTQDEMVEIEKNLHKGGFKKLMSEYTCYDCARNDECHYSFDPYNIHGDCLELK
jgi:hypothetical protein